MDLGTMALLEVVPSVTLLVPFYIQKLRLEEIKLASACSKLGAVRLNSSLLPLLSFRL